MQPGWEFKTSFKNLQPPNLTLSQNTQIKYTASRKSEARVNQYRDLEWIRWNTWLVCVYVPGRLAGVCSSRCVAAILWRWTLGWTAGCGRGHSGSGRFLEGSGWCERSRWPVFEVSSHPHCLQTDWHRCQGNQHQWGGPAAEDESLRCRL